MKNGRINERNIGSIKNDGGIKRLKFAESTASDKLPITKEVIDRVGKTALSAIAIAYILTTHNQYAPSGVISENNAAVLKGFIEKNFVKAECYFNIHAKENRFVFHVVDHESIKAQLETWVAVYNLDGFDLDELEV